MSDRDGGDYDIYTMDAALTPEEGHQVYKMLRFRVSAHQDGTLEVSGVFGDSFVSGYQHQDIGRPQRRTIYLTQGRVPPDSPGPGRPT